MSSLSFFFFDAQVVAGVSLNYRRIENEVCFFIRLDEVVLWHVTNTSDEPSG